MKHVVDVPTAQTMAALGERFDTIGMLRTVYLSGDLGAGKTTLVRGILAGLGIFTPVKSPTFTLVETYNISDKTIYHFDLYRIEQSAELDFIGLEDYFQDANLCLVEWPERGKGVLPPADVEIAIHIKEQGRRVTIESRSADGEGWLGGIIKSAL